MQTILAPHLFLQPEAVPTARVLGARIVHLRKHRRRCEEDDESSVAVALAASDPLFATANE
jgi:hypothetical protein